ncbi:TatD related DNase [Halalkalicoccus paucihalophilus]|uniref:TatD related DNase n=1 Tax=Halalkalicoccus paucihalophilus TaxID=1008153 RepID=A0A151AH53_9EURY|nr:TatD family hydrolase [Halalkalicoccus paucihalophilus]KYH26880.1 TatD related DNase [Halalkalicoccus paucihalophilus]
MASFANRPLGDTPDGKTPDPIEIPWIDIHQHTQSLTWNDREKFDLSGARAAVMIAAGYYWAPYRPVSADDVRFLWDDALRRAACFDHRHFYDQYVAVGVHTWAGVEGAEDLLAALPEYCADERVVAIGETGIESTHHTVGWGLDEQRDVVREQMHVAYETGLPILIHTPGSSKGGLSARYSHSYEEANESFTDPLLDPETAKRDAVEIDLELVDEAGLPDEQVVIDHASPQIVPLVLETTDCYLSFSVSAPWLRGFDPADVASAIEEYGSDRIVLDTDLIGAMEHDAFAMKRTIMDLCRLGVDREDIRTVVYENPSKLLDID